MTAALLFACGLLVAAIFALAALEGSPEQRSVVSPLYAADLLGGSMGSIVASFFFIPVAGLGGSAWAMAVLALAALILA